MQLANVVARVALVATEPTLVATEATLVATKTTLAVPKSTQADRFGFVYRVPSFGAPSVSAINPSCGRYPEWPRWLPVCPTMVVRHKIRLYGGHRVDFLPNRHSGT
jgi:hypothetical protein